MPDSLVNTPQAQALSDAFKDAATQSGLILMSCLELNRETLRSNQALSDKISQRLDKGREFSAADNYRLANVMHRHAIDLIMQEDVSLFNQHKKLRNALIQYRDHDLNVVTPLWEAHSSSSITPTSLPS